ncbi:hypothetical protein BDZ97DRAFT_2054011 [Flammula alnicola]|nr:hypothetical protein BDZ97DRAFT_2054011 [Flammula alnicola]
MSVKFPAATKRAYRRIGLRRTFVMCCDGCITFGVGEVTFGHDEIKRWDSDGQAIAGKGKKTRHQSTLDVEQKVFSILDAYLQPSSEMSATTAAEEIDKLFPTNTSSSSLEFTSLMHLWDLFIVVVEQIPWQHPSQDKVAALMKAIHDLPNPRTIVIADWDNRQATLWTDLPILDDVLTDNVETHGIIINNDSDEEKQSRIHDINFQGFAARLTAEGVFDLSRLAVYRLRNVLEEDPDYYIAGYDKVGPHLDACILPANVWVSLAAKTIFGFCRANGEGASRNDMAGGKHWKGSAGFSVEQWQFWKQRLEEIAVNDEASKETRAVAKKMKETMIAAEA